MELTPEIREQALRELMSERGQVKSPRKTAAAAENGKLGGRPKRDIADIACTCTPDQVDAGHKRSCPRGKALRRREEKGET